MKHLLPPPPHCLQPPSSVSSTQSYTITFAAGSAGTNTDGVKGAVARARLAKDELDLVRTTPGAHHAGFGALDALALFGDDVARLAGSDADQWKQTLQGFSAVRSAAVKEVNQMADQTKNRHSYVLGLLKKN